MTKNLWKRPFLCASRIMKFFHKAEAAELARIPLFDTIKATPELISVSFRNPFTIHLSSAACVLAARPGAAFSREAGVSGARTLYAKQCRDSIHSSQT